ncbi:hypothetical protein JMG10_11120 [Nostoc ellipsosporum NOK]|nr:hypothetical protein [Nostoc ellipsosporum NOK]
MSTEFFISLTLLTPEGPQSFARFTLGGNQKYATGIFNALQGTSESDSPTLLQLEFTELSNGLPVNIKLKDCTLDQLSWNCKYLTKEAFKRAGMNYR